MGILRKIANRIEDTVSPSRRRVKRRLRTYVGPQPGATTRKRRRKGRR